jgi:acetolactate synthase-1/2/3 large subunit
MAGGFGTHGTRAANFAVQNSDLIISIGCRLDTKATGSPQHFARCARVAMVDIDPAEIQKFDKLGRQIDIGICQDAGEFLKHLSEQTFGNYWHDTWIKRIQEWKLRYARPKVDWPGINPYLLMRDIKEYTTKEDIICTDTGFALGWTMQAFPFKGERFIHAFNMTPMGYGLPAAIGAAFATGRRVVLITGDGSIMMSLPELATIKRWNLPIKIILLNNGGHGMCRQTQRQWLGGRYHATSIQGGLGFPNWDDCFKSFGIVECFDLVDLFREQRPSFFEVPIDPDAQLVPQAKYGQPIEDADPQLPWEELCEQMIIPPLERPKI